LQFEVDNKALKRDLEELRAQTAEQKKREATARSEQQKIEEMQRKLKAESDTVTKLRKTQQDHKKVELLAKNLFFVHTTAL